MGKSILQRLKERYGIDQPLNIRDNNGFIKADKTKATPHQIKNKAWRSIISSKAIYDIVIGVIVLMIGTILLVIFHVLK